MYQQVYQIDRGVELHVSIYYLDLDNSQERHFRRDPYKTYLSHSQLEDNRKANLSSKKAASVLNKISTEFLLRLYHELPSHCRGIATSSCSYSFIPRGSYLDKPPHIRALLQAVDLGELQLRLFTSEVSPRVDMSALNLALQQVLLEERQEYDRIEAEYQKKSTAGKAWAHTKNIGEGFYDAGTSLVGWLSDVNDLISVQGRVRRMRDAYQKTLVQCGEVPADTCNATQRFLGNLSDNQFNDLSRVLGFDPRDVSVEQIEQAVEAVELIWENPQLRSRLTQFAKQYVAAQHSLEVSTFAGGAAFEIVLTIILAALTAGVGAAASLTAKARKLKSFKRIGDILLDYVKQIKLFKANKKGKAESKENGGSAPVEAPENSVGSATRLKVNSTRPREFEAIYVRAPAAKVEIDKISDEISNMFDGKTAKAPIKSRDRAIQKINDDYGGDPTRIKDLARNTIIVPSDKVNLVVAELSKRGAKVKVIDGSVDPLGYSGVNSTISTKAGVSGEIQVNTPEMIYAKESEAVARVLLGDELYNSIGVKSEMPGGHGHKYYEQWRVLPESDPRRPLLEAESKAYYDEVRKSVYAN
ncbi:MAG: hypothetical protein K6L73_10995 [Cellvibrionaceae bacterium]